MERLYSCFIKIAHMIVGEYEQRAVYKCYKVVPVRFMVIIGKYNRLFYSQDEPCSVCAHSASVCDCHCNQAYLPGTRDTVMM